MSWQEVLRGRLVERNTRESAYAGIIEQCEQHQTRRETTPPTTSNHLGRSQTCSANQVIKDQKSDATQSYERSNYSLKSKCVDRTRK